MVDIVGAALGAIAQMGLEAGFEAAKRHESIVRLLKSLGLEPDQPPLDFDGAYVYALVEFGAAKPQAVLELFRHDQVRQAFQTAFEKGNWSLVSVVVQDLIDWHTIGETFKEMDVDPRRFISEFAEAFQSVIDRSRPTYVTRQDQKLDALLDHQSTILGSQAAVMEELHRLQSSVSALTAPKPSILGSEASPNSARDRILDAQISQAGALVSQGKVLAAKVMLERLAGEIKGQTVSDTIRFRLETNLAACFYNLSENERAAEHFDRALAFDPGSAVALANAALGAFLCGQHARACQLARRALETDADQPTALSVLIQVSARLEEFDSLAENIRQAARRHPDSRRALAVILSERGDFETAIELYRFNLESPEAPVQDAMLLAQVMTAATRQALLREDVLPWRIPDTHRQTLEEAEALATRAIDAWRLDDNRNQYHEALVTRSVLRGMLGKPQTALDDCHAVLQENHTHYHALVNAGVAALQLNQWKEATTMLEQAMAIQNLPGSQIPLAAVYLHERRYRDVLRVLGEFKASEQTEDLQRLELAAQAYHNLGQEDRVERIAKQLETFGENNPAALEAVASIRKTQKRFEEAKDCLKRALAQGGKHGLIALTLANLHLQMGEPREAVPLYEAIVDTAVDCPPTRDYLISLLNAGYWDRAHTLAQALRRNGPAIPVVSAVEARVAEYIGDLDRAHRLYSELAELQPEDPEHLFRAAMVDARRGKAEDAACVFDISLNRFWDDPLSLIAIAQLWATAHRPAEQILRVAYQARRVGSNLPEVHLAYGGIFFHAESIASFLDPDQVALDTSVRIRAGNQERWVTILDDVSADKAKSEFPLHDPLAQKLLGRKPGESVQLKSGPYETLSYDIVEIQSKYVRALQDTFNDFGTLFPDHQGLHKVEVPLGDPSKMLALAGQHSQFAQLVYDEYARRQIPLGLFARLIGRSQIEVWGGLVSGGGHVNAALGNVAEQAEQAQVVEQADDVTIDVISLLTLADLKCLDLIRTRFGKMYVAQTTVDELSADIYSKRLFTKGQGFISVRDGRYFFEEVPPEAIQRGIDFLEGLRTWILENADIVPASLLLGLGPIKYQKLCTTLGAPAIDSILVASERSAILLSDDLALRALARNDFGVQGVWTQPVLTNCLNRGLFSPDEFHSAILRLIQANYSYVAVSSDLLVHSLRGQQWIVSSEFSKILNLLAGSTTSEQSAVSVLADFLKVVWLERILLEHKVAITDLGLEALTKNRLAARVVPKLRQAIHERLTLAPVQLQQLEDQISSWQRLRRFATQSNSLWG